ncbi:MAG: hypothetical protein E7H28_00135 [Finegoldia magna]|nr:hypothetical protein [Finegoldia magna]
MNNYTRNKLSREIRKYYLTKEGLLAVDEKIRELQDKKLRVKGIDMSVAPNFDGGSRYEDSLLDIISDLDMLEKNKKIMLQRCKVVEKCFDGMKEFEKELLLKMYGERCNIDKLCRHFNYSRGNLYKISTRALEEFGLLLYAED